MRRVTTLRVRPVLIGLAMGLGLSLAACSGGDEEAEELGHEQPSAGDDATAAGDDPAADDDVDDGVVTVLGFESAADEAGAIQDALDELSVEAGIPIRYTGVRDFDAELAARLGSDDGPDIVMFDRPAALLDLVDQGAVEPLPSEVADAADASWGSDWNRVAVVDGEQYGVPTGAEVKSLVWYQPARFEEFGYTVPETWNEFRSLVTAAVADGNTPLCVGIESGPTTGRVFTDWTEDLVLRLSGPDTYDRWVTNQIPFDDEAVTGPMEEIVELWNTPGVVFAGGGTIATTPFGDNGQYLVDGECLMHRESDRYIDFIPDGSDFGIEEDPVDVFPLPADEGRPIVVGASLAAAVRDAPEVWEVMAYLSSADYADARRQAQNDRVGEEVSGFLSAAAGLDTSLYSGIEASFVEIVLGADVARYDASDLMPPAVGSGTFWSEGTAIVAGEKTAAEGAQAIDASWTP